MVIKQHDGYIIRLDGSEKAAGGVHSLYIKSIYKGLPCYTLDYAHAKTYKSEKTAARINERINAGKPL